MKNLQKKALIVIYAVLITAIFHSCKKDDPEPMVTVSANAGTDQEVEIGNLVTLDGSGSSSSDASALTFSWTLSSKPPASTASINGGSNVSATLTPDIAGVYIIDLSVTSGTASDTDQVNITAIGTNSVPLITITEDSIKGKKNNAIDIMVTSSDPDGDALAYSWEILETTPANGSGTFTTGDDTGVEFTPSDPGLFEIAVTVSDGKGGEGADTVLLFIGNVLSTNITTSMNMENYFEAEDCPDWYLISNVDFLADVSVEEGVLLIASDDVGISVEIGGSLNAVGTAVNSIIFTGEMETKGFWKGIEIVSNTISNELAYFELHYGGSSGFDGANLKSNVMLDDAGRLKIINSTFTNSGGYGLYTREIESTLVDFSNNSFSDNMAPIMTRINHYQYFDTESDYTGNTNDYIDSYWSNSETTQNVTWNALNVPYRLAPNVEDIASDITISPGTQFIGQPGSGIDVILGGSIKAVGNASSMIVFKGQEDVRGYWKGLNISSNNTNNELKFVSISNGGEDGFDGANLKANIMVEDAGRIILTNVTSTKSAGWGLYTRDLESVLVDFADNTFSDNVAPIMTRFNHFHFFDGNSDYTGNDNDYIDTYWSNSGLEGTVVWKKLNVPYRLTDNIEDIKGDVTINAGASFIGKQNAGLEIQTTGSLNAVGTLGNEISFKGEQNVQGYWRGLRFLSNNASNVLDFIEIANGGSSGFDGANRKANIEVGSAGLLTITNSNISESGGDGIRVQAGGSLTQTGNSFTNNVGTDIQID